MNSHWDQYKNKSVEFWDGVKVALQYEQSNLKDALPFFHPDDVDRIVAGLGDGEIAIDQIDQYTIAYRRKKELETKLKLADEKVQVAKEVIVDYLDGLMLSFVRRGNISISRSRRTYQSVEDYDALMAWVKEQDEPESLYIKQAFIAGSAKDEAGLYLMVQDAQKRSVTEGKPVSQCYPEGLKVSVKDIVTIRKARKESTGLPGPQSAIDEYKKATESF